FLANPSSTISLQQLAQSSAFRTNLGIAEAAGQQAPVVVTAFDGVGKQVLNLPLTLKPGQLLQLNSIFSQNGVTSLANGRAEVKAFDNLLQATFGLTNTGGALHVTTASNTPLIVTARTFNQTSDGTLGQFITAVTPADAVGAGDRSLQLLQVEESPRLRTNLG